MGNNTAKPANRNYYSHPRLGNVSRIQSQNQDPYLIYQLVLDSSKLYDQWAYNIKALQSPNQDILFLPTSHRYEMTNYCGTGGVAVLTYEDYLYSLEPEINNRRDIKRPFNEQQLLYLFYSLVKLQAFMESRGLTVGDIKPENMLVNQDGYVKVLSQYSYPAEPSRITTWNKAVERSFPAPEELLDKTKKLNRVMQVVQVDNKNMCEVFSIGLSILEAGCLKDCSEVYGFTNEYCYNQSKVRQYLYSLQFTYLLSQMLQSDPNRRITANAVYERLKPYEEYIINLEQVEIKIPSNEFIPKVKRKEKVSIKKLGESHTTSVHADSVMKSSPNPFGLRQTNYAKISINSSIANPPYVSNIPVQEPNPFSKSLDSGVYHPERQSNASLYPHQPDPPQQNELRPEIRPSQALNSVYREPHVQQRPPNPLLNSMPPVFKQSKRSNGNQFLTQNSMVEHYGRNSEPYQIRSRASQNNNISYIPEPIEEQPIAQNRGWASEQPVVTTSAIRLADRQSMSKSSQPSYHH